MMDKRMPLKPHQNPKTDVRIDSFYICHALHKELSNHIELDFSNNPTISSPCLFSFLTRKENRWFAS